MGILSLTAKHQNVCVTYWKWTDVCDPRRCRTFSTQDMRGTRGGICLFLSLGSGSDLWKGAPNSRLSRQGRNQAGGRKDGRDRPTFPDYKPPPRIRDLRLLPPAPASAQQMVYSPSSISCLNCCGMRVDTLPAGLSQVRTSAEDLESDKTRADGRPDSKRGSQHRFFSRSCLKTSLPVYSIQQLSVLIILAR